MTIEARLSIPANHPALPGHFPAQPIVPGVLLLDEVRTHVESASGRRVKRIEQLKFVHALGPEEQAWLQAQIRLDRVSFRVTGSRAGDAITLAQGSLVLE